LYAFCDKCQQFSIKDFLKSYDGKLIARYCQRCDSIKCIDVELNSSVRLVRLREKLKNNHELIFDLISDEFYGFYLFYIGRYLPRRWYTQDDFSKKILEFKDGNLRIIRVFSIAVTIFTLFLYKIRIIYKPDVIIPIPSSSASKISLGHKYLCEYLSKRLNIENGTGYLKRIESVPSAHLSDVRPTVDDHYQTIHCLGDVSGKSILLFDDVYTTGNTARACAKRLVENGARHVTLITLGRTV
jgi:hypothetical protein